MTQRIYILSALLFLQTFFSQQTDAIYYNKDWKVTIKEKALFYRLTPLKELGELILLQDFYINGTPQFEGYTYKGDENKYVGDIAWYDENGNDTTFRKYQNSTTQSNLIYYYPNGTMRKVVEYKKGLKVTETIYHQDGTVLMKGIFKNGKPFSGDFGSIKNLSNYEDFEELATTTSVLASPPPKTLEVEVVEVRNIPSTKPNGKKIAVSEKIFWANSKQIAQETLYIMGSYDFKSVQQKNYDQSGKLLQTLTNNQFEDYGNTIKNGNEYDYYLQNNFATSLKSVTQLNDQIKSGKAISYYPNGKVATETLFINGDKEGEETVFTEDGTVKAKRIYKKDEPFEGNFEENKGEFVLNLNFIKGKKEGEATAKNEKKEIVAKGIYKEGKPFNGTFIVESDDQSDQMELINVENYKKIGLQKVFNYRLENISETYTLQNEKLNGTTTFYNYEKPIATLEYKNDEPFEGTLIEGKRVSLFKNGKITRETIYNSEYAEKNEDQISTEKFYENGILSKIVNRNFQITEKSQSTYEGIYKNGKAFSGFFETEYDREFKQVDFYENGQKKFQYSNDYLENMENYRYQKYDIKSTYKDGKIFDGVEYEMKGRQFISRYLKNGALTSFDWDLFALHYFNRIHLELKGNTIKVNDMQEKSQGSIIIESAKNSFTKKLMINGRLVNTKNYSDNKAKTPTVTLYSLKNNELISKNTEILPFDEEPMGESEWILRIYQMIDHTLSNAQQVFNHLSQNIGTENILTGIRIDAEGKPQDGILITENTDKTYLLQSFSEGKMTKQTQNVVFNNLEKEIENLERTN